MSEDKERDRIQRDWVRSLNLTIHAKESDRIGFTTISCYYRDMTEDAAYTTYGIEVPTPVAVAILEGLQLWSEVYEGPLPWTSEPPYNDLHPLAQASRKWTLAQHAIKVTAGMDKPLSKAPQGSKPPVTQVMTADGSVHVITGFTNGLMHLTVDEAVAFTNMLRYALRAAMPRKLNPLEPRKDCVHCDQDRVHDRHETINEVNERISNIARVVRSQMGAPPPDS